MDTELRRQNLRLLAAQWGGFTGLASKLGFKGPSYISQMVSGLRPISEKTVRKIERQLELPAGWIDRDHGRAEEVPVSIDENLMRRVILTVGAVLEELGINPGAAKFADLVELIYEDAKRKRGIDKEFIQRVSKLTGRN